MEKIKCKLAVLINTNMLRKKNWGKKLRHKFDEFTQTDIFILYNPRSGLLPLQFIEKNWIKPFGSNY